MNEMTPREEWAQEDALVRRWPHLRRPGPEPHNRIQPTYGMAVLDFIRYASTANKQPEMLAFLKTCLGYAERGGEDAR